jgi:hypothetical protein
MNEFSKSEAALVDDILTMASQGVFLEKDSPQFMVRIKEYAQPCDQQAAAQAVAQLVIERLENGKQ